ncbi:MAG: hypothetical protein GAK28_03712 [Luteibacter sp.]|nr:MAG: hypothetical protein GAK28_03712 [Luteibacter sp.]
MHRTRMGCLAALLFFVSADASAAIKWLSRANCVGGTVNESVTYDRPQLKTHFMYTESHHVGFGAVGGHVVTAPWNVTWRSYAGDIGDVSRNTVRGVHVFGDNLRFLATEYTIATDCNLREW